MLLQDLEAQRDVLDQLASRRVSETNTRQFEGCDLPEVVQDGSRDEPVEIQARVVSDQSGAQVADRQNVFEESTSKTVVYPHCGRSNPQALADRNVIDYRLQKLPERL